ncbi:MAG: J domain-containing protein [Thermodesulfobacteriota bacterium]
MTPEGNITYSGLPPANRDDRGLYLARPPLAGQPCFVVRQTCRDEASGLLFHRDIAPLGNDPQLFIHYQENGGYTIDDRLIATIGETAGADAEELVADLLWPFVRLDVRTRLESFRHRGRGKATTPVTPAEQEAIAREMHDFDRRRLHYLWYGAIDQSRLHRMPNRLCRRLLNRCRDEKEQFFITMEQNFFADEIKRYLYAVFDLQRHFSESYARIMPEGLNEERLDACFVETICRLNRDPNLWQGLAETAGLQPYLIRYLILFFDYDFAAGQAIDDYIRQFINSHRTFRFPQKKGTMSRDEASAVFGETREKLDGMSKRELTRLYRHKAKQLHPDTGGGHDEFVRLTAAFEELLRRR